MIPVGTSEYGVTRVLQMIGVLASSAAPVSRREIARRVGCSEAAVRKHLPRMTMIAPIEEDDAGRLCIRREALALWLRAAGWPVEVREPEPVPHPVMRPSKARKIA